MVKNAEGGLVMEGNRVEWQYWPCGRGKVRNQNTLGGDRVRNQGQVQVLSVTWVGVNQVE